MVTPRITFKHNTFLLVLGLTRNMGLTPPIKTTTPKKRWDVRDIPSDKRVCVHIAVEEEELSEGLVTKVNRCTFPATRRAQNGFLCSRHQTLLDRKVNPPYVDWDKHIVEDILMTEAVAIFEATHDGHVEFRRPPHSKLFFKVIN